MTLNESCPIDRNCIRLSEIARTQPEGLEPFKAMVCRNCLACQDYQTASGAIKAIMDAVAAYDNTKDTQINTESSIQKNNK